MNKALSKSSCDLLSKSLVSSSHLGKQKELTCGIIGGLGPEATINFLSSILAKTAEMYGADEDQSHIHTVVELNPKVPNRNASIFGTGVDCGPSLKKMAENLSSANVDFIVCACNTAHAYRKEME